MMVIWRSFNPKPSYTARSWGSIACGFGRKIRLAQLSTIAGAMVERGTGGQFQLRLDGGVWLLGVVAIVLMSLAVGLLPALRARRLKIVDALAGR